MSNTPQISFARTRTPLAMLALAMLTLGGCGAEEDADPVAEVEVPSAAAAPAELPSTPEPAPTPEPEPAAPSASGTMTIAALRTAFAADADTWTGREVTLTGLFSSATTMNGSVNNISLLATRDDDFMSSVICGFGDDAPASVDLMQYAEVTVRGTVRERFGRPALEQCSIVP